MAKYRIRVESIDGTEEMDERFVNGIECDGFAILGDVNGEGKGVTAIHKMNIITLSAMMQSSDIFREAQKLSMMVNIMDLLNPKKPADDSEEFLRNVIGSLSDE